MTKEATTTSTSISIPPVSFSICIHDSLDTHQADFSELAKLSADASGDDDAEAGDSDSELDSDWSHEMILKINKTYFYSTTSYSLRICASLTVHFIIFIIRLDIYS